MGRFSRFLLLLLVLVAAAWGILFSLANTSRTTLDLVVITLPEGPLAVWVLGAFVLGGLGGLLASSAAIWRARRR